MHMALAISTVHHDLARTVGDLLERRDALGETRAMLEAQSERRRGRRPLRQPLHVSSVRLPAGMHRTTATSTCWSISIPTQATNSYALLASWRS